MNILDILYTTLIMPLQLMFEVLYMLGYRMIGDPGLSIIVLSLMMNFLVLPLYMRADKMQEDERDMENRLREGVRHIRSTFKGDEKMMMLNTYYRQNNYKPTDVIKGSVSLFLEIPFFISAYMFLSHLELLKGVPFGIIPDLGAPDGLIHIAGLSINVLPFIMTGINLISCIIFTKGMPAKTKVQLYGMALFFLVFLYASPAGLVFYWTLNNLFALIKTIFYKLPNPKRTLKILFGVVGVIALIYGAFGYQSDSIKKHALIIFIGIVCMAPALISALRMQKRKSGQAAHRSFKLPAHRKRVYFASTLVLIVLTGVLIPSAVLASSPQEFIDITVYVDPIWYVVSATCLAVGTFGIWMGVFYWLTASRYKGVFDLIMAALCVIAVINYLFFGTNLGILDNMLRYESGLGYTLHDNLINAGICIVVAVVMYVLYHKTTKILPTVLGIMAVAFVGMSAMNISGITTKVAEAAPVVKQAQESQPSFTLSKTGKNVVVIMLDRSLNQYIPYIMNEKPEIKAQFDGFTHYDNVISFGGFTNFGTPGLYGGYEYTPVEMNKRNTELLKDKQNEALRVMPLNFDDAGFDVTVMDPTYAGYQWKADLSIYDDRPNINKYLAMGKFSDPAESLARINANKRNFFCYSIVKSAPIFMQPTLYNKGKYNSGSNLVDLNTAQTASKDGLMAQGIDQGFKDSYNELVNLGTMTRITDENTPNSDTPTSAQNTGENIQPGSFVMMSNDTTHNPMILSEPDYKPAPSVDNRAYEREHHDRFTLDGKSIIIDEWYQYSHYHVNVAAFSQLGEWFDYLRAQGVYDNTRIILVSDHGNPMGSDPARVLPHTGDTNQYDTAFYYPALLVKDFDAHGYTVSHDFMTNADVPTMAFKDVIPHAKNPATGKLITNDEKFAHDQYILSSHEWSTDTNNGTTFLPGKWFKVHDDMNDLSNWQEVPDPLGPGGDLAQK